MGFRIEKRLNDLDIERFSSLLPKRARTIRLMRGKFFDGQLQTRKINIRQQNRICVKDRPQFTAPLDGEKMDRPPQVVFTLRDFVEIRPDLNDLCHQLFRRCLAGRCWKKLREGGRAPADSSKSMMRESCSRLQGQERKLASWESARSAPR